MFVDGDCGFCMRTAAQIHRLGVDVQARVLQDQDLAGAGIDEARALREIAVIDAHGAIHYGYLGWAAILATGPWPWRALGVVMGRGPGAAVARAAYRWVSENRTRLPGGTLHVRCRPPMPPERP